MNKEIQKKNRLDWVDIAKAISIIAIIVGHIGPLFNDPENAAYIPGINVIFLFVYSFHVPLFFILAGYTSKPGLPTIDSTARLFSRTFLPYIITGLFSILYCMLILPDQNLGEWLAAFSYGSGLYRDNMLLSKYPFGVIAIGAIWFLPALFIGKFISMLLSKIPFPWLRIGLTLALFVVGTYTAEIVFLPMDIQQGLCASFYITTGMVLSEYKILSELGKGKVALAIGGTLGLIYMYLIATATIFNPVYTNSIYPSWVFDALGTLCASITVISISQLISWFVNPVEKGLALMGRSTLPIFCFHSIMMSPALAMNQWAAKVCSDGMDPILLFSIVTIICITLPIIFALISRMIPGLRHVYYPGKKSIFAKENVA